MSPRKPLREEPVFFTLSSCGKRSKKSRNLSLAEEKLGVVRETMEQACSPHLPLAWRDGLCRCRPSYSLFVDTEFRDRDGLTLALGQSLKCVRTS